MAVFHAGSLGLLPFLQFPGDRLVNINMTDQTLQVLQRQSAGTQQPGRLAGQIQDGGFHAHRTGAAIHNTFDFTVHILQNILRRSTAGAAGRVGAGCGNGNSRLPDDGQRHRMVGTAYRHSIKTGSGFIRHYWATL